MNLPPKTARRRSGLGARLSALLGAALSGLVALGCGSTGAEPASRRAQPIAGGTADALHQNVFLLVSETQNSGSLCTATLIAPNLLLTARHCVSPGNGDDHVLCGDSVLEDPYPASAFFATNDARPGHESPIFRAVAVRVPGLGEDTCGYDLALVILKESVPSDISMPAVPRIDLEVEPGEAYTAVGYGLDEAGKSPGGRMQLDGLSVECEPGSCGDGVESTEFLGEKGICSGDSGGPAFDRDGKVVGVVSRGGPECSTPIYSTVTAWHDFIVDTAKEAATLGGYEAPFWVTSGLSDPPVLVGQGGESGAGGPSSSGAASEGEACDATTACESELVCYIASAEPNATAAPNATGRCSATCQLTTDCRDGLVCQSAGTVSVCTLPSVRPKDPGGCTLSRGPSRPGAGQLLAALTALGFMSRRRRRSARA